MTKKILLAEDDPFILDIYSQQFRSEGFKVDLAKDGQMALDKIVAEYPDLLVLDIDLPKVNGLEVLKQIKENPQLQKIKVIILSNYDEARINEKYQVRVEDLGVERYFLKVNIMPEEVMKAIKEILGESN